MMASHTPLCPPPPHFHVHRTKASSQVNFLAALKGGWTGAVPQVADYLECMTLARSGALEGPAARTLPPPDHSTVREMTENPMPAHLGMDSAALYAQQAHMDDDSMLELLEALGEEPLQLTPATTMQSAEVEGKCKLRDLVEVCWTSGIDPREQVTAKDLVYDLLAVYLNMSLWLMGCAEFNVRAVRLSDDNLKIAYEQLILARSVLEFISVHRAKIGEEGAAASDLSPRFLQAAVFQCAAQAQEITLYQASRRGHKAELQASLSSEATCSYRRAMQATQSLVEERPGNGRLYKLLNYFKYKTRVQATITYQLMARDCKDKGMYGLATACSKKAHELIQSAGKELEAFLSAPPELPFQRQAFTPLLEGMTRALFDEYKQIQRENYSVFYEAVPEAPPLCSPMSLLTSAPYIVPSPSPQWDDALTKSLQRVPPPALSVPNVTNSGGSGSVSIMDPSHAPGLDANDSRGGQDERDTIKSVANQPGNNKGKVNSDSTKMPDSVDGLGEEGKAPGADDGQNDCAIC